MGKRKRERDSEFLDALKDMGDASQPAIQQSQEQRHRYLQIFLDGQANGMEIRREELLFQQANTEEYSYLQRDFTVLFILGQLVHFLKAPCALLLK